MKQFFRKTVVAVVVATSLSASFVLPILPLHLAVAKGSNNPQHQMPIKQVLPTNQAVNVRPDTPIQLVIDPTAPTYNRFREQFEKGFFEVTLNNEQVSATYDQTTKTITVANSERNRYTTYTLVLTSKADMQSGNNNSHNSTYTYSFTTGSALHEATQLSVQMKKPQVRVTETGNIDVKVTDDYGLPATNATVKTTCDSVNVTASDLLLGETEQGEGIVEVTDHVKEKVICTVTSQDNIYDDAANTQKAQAQIEFLAGLPDHMTVQADSPLTVGMNETVTGTVFDKYNNRVENDTEVTATPTAGDVTPEKQHTNNGDFAFVFTAPVKVQDVIITAKAGEASGSTMVKLKPDQAANMQVDIDTPFIPADGKTAAHAVITVTDKYGNPIPNATLNLASSSAATFLASVTTNERGQAIVPVTCGQAGDIVIEVSTDNGVKNNIVLKCEPIVAHETVIVWEAIKGANGKILIKGRCIDLSGTPQARVAIPVLIGGKTIYPITDGFGEFTLELEQPSASTTISVPTIENRPQIVVGLPVGSAWTDTGIDLEVGAVVRSADNLYGRTGGMIELPIGSGYYNFGQAATGRLYVRADEPIDGGIIYIEDECHHFAPKFDLTTSATELPADGKSTATIQGQLWAVTKEYVKQHIVAPVVGGQVTITLSDDNGVLSQTIVTTDHEGKFTTTYTAGTKAGKVQIIVSYQTHHGTASDSIELELTGSVVEAIDIPEFQQILAANKKLIYVDAAKGNNANNGRTPETAVASINRAVDLASHGDGIFVKKGTYREKSTKVFWTSPHKKYSNVVVTKSVTIIGEDIDETVILIDGSNTIVGATPGGSAHAMTLASPYIKIKNMTFRIETNGYWAFINYWGQWESWSARNSTLENIIMETRNPIGVVFYMNDYNFTLRNVTFKGKGKVYQAMFYTNWGSITFNHSLFDIPYSSMYGRVSYSTPSSFLNVNTNIFTDYTNGDFHIKDEFQSTYKAGAYYGTYYDNGQKYVVE